MNNDPPPQHPADRAPFTEIVVRLKEIDRPAAVHQQVPPRRRLGCMGLPRAAARVSIVPVRRLIGPVR